MTKGEAVVATQRAAPLSGVQGTLAPLAGGAALDSASWRCRLANIDDGRERLTQAT